VTGVPALAIERMDANTVEISWANHPAPFRLESTAQLDWAGWQLGAGVTSLINGRRVLKLSTTEPRRFFRLALP
jgi:hypothetical protein